MSSTIYNLIERCYEKNITPQDCYELLTEEYTNIVIPAPNKIRAVYREIEEVYDRF